MSRGHTACSTFGFGEDTLTFGLIIFSYFQLVFFCWDWSLLLLLLFVVDRCCVWQYLCLISRPSDWKRVSYWPNMGLLWSQGLTQYLLLLLLHLLRTCPRFTKAINASISLWFQFRPTNGLFMMMMTMKMQMEMILDTAWRRLAGDDKWRRVPMSSMLWIMIVTSRVGHVLRRCVVGVLQIRRRCHLRPAYYARRHWNTYLSRTRVVRV